METRFRTVFSKTFVKNVTVQLFFFAGKCSRQSERLKEN